MFTVVPWLPWSTQMTRLKAGEARRCVTGRAADCVKQHGASRRCSIIRNCPLEPVARPGCQEVHDVEGTLDTPRFHRVQYEALVAEPERTVRGICNFLREDYDPAMLDSHRSDVPYPTDSRNALNLRKPILANNSGKWRQEMSARDLRIFEAVAGNALEQYGYERGVPGARISSAEALSCRFIEHPPRKAISMMQNIKSQKIQLQRMRIYLRLRLGL